MCMLSVFVIVLVSVGGTLIVLFLLIFLMLSGFSGDGVFMYVVLIGGMLVVVWSV